MVTDRRLRLVGHINCSSPNKAAFSRSGNSEASTWPETASRKTQSYLASEYMQLRQTQSHRISSAWKYGNIQENWLSTVDVATLMRSLSCEREKLHSVIIHMPCQRKCKQFNNASCCFAQTCSKTKGSIVIYKKNFNDFIANRCTCIAETPWAPTLMFYTYIQ